MITKIPYKHPAWIEVDLNQFKKNIDIIRKQLGKTLLCLPIKANAYGHGLISIGKAAKDAGVDYLAVSCLQEGIQLREAAINIPILVMGALHEDQIPDLIAHKLEFTISSAFKASLVRANCIRDNLTCKVHIEVESGMQRTGMKPATALALLKDLKNCNYIEVVGAYSHLAISEKPQDPVTGRQIQIFTEFKEEAASLGFHKLLFHLGNSGGLCHYPKARFNMIRPGILIFGYFHGQKNDALSEIKPFFSLKAKIAYFKVVEKGEGIGYGYSFITKAPTRIVTIPVGYGDGFRRALSNRGKVLIRGKAYPIVGNICMDQLMVDIGEDEAYVGEEVVLIGKQNGGEIPLKNIADLCDTIPYEILCGFNQRLPRYYINS